MIQTGITFINQAIGTTRIIGFLTLMCVSFTSIAQDTLSVRVPQAQLRRDRLVITTTDTLTGDSGIQAISVVIPSEKQIRKIVEKQFFVPDPKKALWLAIAFPGGGHIYNRKYWKLPLIYGGFVGCVYALNWNNTMYHDYSQAYIDIMDDDPNTKSYENFIPRNYNVSQNLTRIQDLFRRKKNYYRRYRDLSMFCMIGVYALSIIDAYVDAELSSFDISKNLSMKVRPSLIRDKHAMTWANPIAAQSYGVECSINF